MARPCFAQRLASYLNGPRFVPKPGDTNCSPHPTDATPWTVPSVVRALTALVYGSNRIESAGPSLEVTQIYCEALFQDQNIAAVNGVFGCLPEDLGASDIFEDEEAMRINARHKAEGNLLEYDAELADKAKDVAAHREVVQHARALMYMIDKVIFENDGGNEEGWSEGMWSEDLIREAHRILFKGDLSHVGEEEFKSGAYRTYEVSVGYKGRRKAARCMRASAVPRYMAKLMSDISFATSGNMFKRGFDVEDFLDFAASYHHLFVFIHPFGDGNGRMARMLLNVYLLKYVGRFVLFGHADREEEEGVDAAATDGGKTTSKPLSCKEMYLGIVNRGQKVFHQEDGEVETPKHTHYFEFSEWLAKRTWVQAGRDLDRLHLPFMV